MRRFSLAFSAWALASAALAGVYLGDYAEDATLHFCWATTGTSGASITRATNGTVQIYKDNGILQSTAGVTDAEDFDGLTGVHCVTIDLSADAFYATGSDYTIALAGAIVDGATINAALAHFSIEHRYERGTDSAALASSYTAARAAYIDNINGHTAQTGDSFARIGATGSGLTSLAQASVATEARLAELDAANLPTDVDAILVDTADMQPKLGTPAGVSVSADIAAVKTETAAILVDTAEIGAAGAGLTAIPTQAANVTQILGTAIAETNAGDIADSFAFFYDVDPTTTKTVNSVGVAATTLTVSVTAPAIPSTDVDPIIIGDSYLQADGRELLSTSYTGVPSFTGATITFTAVGAVAATGADFSVAATIVDTDTLYVELSAVQTATLKRGSFRYRIRMTAPSVVTLLEGNVRIRTTP